MQHLVKTTIEELSHWIEKPTSEDENFNQIIQKIRLNGQNGCKNLCYALYYKGL